MTGLTTFLAGGRPSGVYRWHEWYDAEQVRLTVERAGRRFAYVDGWQAGNKQDWLTAVGEALDFPDYYGRNLDALHDCLADLTRPTVLLWDGWSTLAGGDARTFKVGVELLGGRDPLTVLLRGDGPDLEIPDLD